MLYSSCTARFFNSFMLNTVQPRSSGSERDPTKIVTPSDSNMMDASIIDRRSFLMTSAEQLGLFGEQYLHTRGCAGFSLTLGINAANALYSRCTAHLFSGP
jgi:hypothetical protein